MKTIKNIALGILSTGVGFVSAQNVGINTDGSAPGMMLDIKVPSGNDGIRINNNSGTGDAMINLQDAGTSRWTFGLDASNGNRFVFDNGGSLTTSNVMVLETGGDVGIGVNNPGVQLEVSSGGATDAFYAYGTNTGGYVGYESNFSFGVTPQTFQGSGFYASNPTAGYTSTYAQSTGSATVAASITYSDVWIPMYAYGDYSGTSSPAAVYAQMNSSSSSNTNMQRAITGFSEYTAGSGNPGYSVGGVLVGNGNSQDSYGSVNAGYSNGEGAVGGYFEGIGGGGGYIVTVADDFQNRKVVGTGSVSEVIPTENHGRIILTCPESPEYWYQDYYTVEMVNGRAHLELDPILVDIIVVDQNNPIRAFCTPVDMLNFNGVSVTNQSPTGIDLIELNGGQNSGTLYVQVIVKPKTNYGEGRFPMATPPAFAKGLELPKAKAENDVYQSNPEKVFEWPSDWEVYGYKDVFEAYLKSLKQNATMTK